MPARRNGGRRPMPAGSSRTLRATKISMCTASASRATAQRIPATVRPPLTPGGAAGSTNPGSRDTGGGGGGAAGTSTVSVWQSAAGSQPYRNPGFTQRRSGGLLVRCATAAGLELCEQFLAAVVLVRAAAATRLDVLSQLQLEAVGGGAVGAHRQVLLYHQRVALRQQLVEICLHAALCMRAGSGRRAHDAAASAVCSIVWASSVLSMRRPRCNRDMIVPIGTSRMSAAS